MGTMVRMRVMVAGAIASGAALFYGAQASAQCVTECWSAIQTSWGNAASSTLAGASTAYSQGTENPHAVNAWCSGNYCGSGAVAYAYGYEVDGGFVCGPATTSGATVASDCPINAVKHRVRLRKSGALRRNLWAFRVGFRGRCRVDDNASNGIAPAPPSIVWI